MIEFKNISNGEGGLSVRTKINSMFQDLISRNEGVNALWNKLRSLEMEVNDNAQENEDYHLSLKAQILNAFDYTDRQITDMKTYVNALESGIGGFIPSTSYNPDVEQGKAYTFIAVGAGTYTNFKGQDGSPIVITDDHAITILYKGAGSTYWQTKSVTPSLIKEAIDGGNASTIFD